MPDDLNELLRSRAETHGDYRKTAQVSQDLKRVIHTAFGQHEWAKTNAVVRESLDLICTKLSRVVAGDTYHPDNFLDIAGYAKLAADIIQDSNESPRSKPLARPIDASKSGTKNGRLPDEAGGSKLPTDIQATDQVAC